MAEAQRKEHKEEQTELEIAQEQLNIAREWWHEYKGAGDEDEKAAKQLYLEVGRKLRKAKDNAK